MESVYYALLQVLFPVILLFSTIMMSKKSFTQPYKDRYSIVFEFYPSKLVKVSGKVLLIILCLIA